MLKGNFEEALSIGINTVQFLLPYLFSSSSNTPEFSSQSKNRPHFNFWAEFFISRFNSWGVGRGEEVGTSFEGGKSGMGVSSGFCSICSGSGGDSG